MRTRKISLMRISVSASVLVAYLKVLSSGQWLTVLIGVSLFQDRCKPPPLRWAMAGRKYHYPSVWVFALNGTAIHWLHGKIARIPSVLLTRHTKTRIDKMVVARLQRGYPSWPYGERTG